MNTQTKDQLKQRLLVFPIIFSFVWYFFSNSFPEFFLVGVAKEMIIMFFAYIELFFAVSINTEFKYIFAIYGFLFGYIYNGLSQVIKVRDIKNTIIAFIVFYIKVMITIFLSPLALIILLIELFVIFRKNSKNKLSSRANYVD